MVSLKSINIKSIDKAKRIVLKVGSSLIVNPNTGYINSTWLENLAQDILFLLSKNKEILIVSSGAIALGKIELNLQNKALKLAEKQAAAAAGQIVLAKAWKNVFEKMQIKCGQILVGHSDLETRRNAMNTRATLNTLIKLKVIPIINENDTVATLEIRYGDNDQLAARIAQLAEADVLILLSDIDGLYSKDPKSSKKAKFIAEVKNISKNIEDMAKNTKSNIASGGMITKIKAAKISTTAGCHLIIARGQDNNSLLKLFMGGKHTIFKANLTPLSAKKKWILRERNKLKFIIIDKDAEKALVSQKNLLASGIKSSSNSYDRGEIIDILSINKKLLGCGIIAYDAKEIKIIKGKKSKDIEKLLGYKGRDEAINKNDMIIN
ncbi:MAG: glutamate 5-kinase [Alphaproteobacteria bacterium]|jgi:glutamate 5-kinase|nr:glutamate 5-kinase [Alphaproteobacteria bacterium]